MNRNASLPYPLLGHNDDYKGKPLTAELTESIESNDKLHIIYYKFTFDKSNEELIEWVAKGKAVLVIEFDCKDTLTNTICEIPAEEAEVWLEEGEGIVPIEIPKCMYANRLDVNVYIVAKESLKLESSKGRFHEEYGADSVFDVEAGDILAIFPPVSSVNLSMDWEHIYRNVGTPVKIVEDDSKSKAVYTKIDGDFIEICLPEDLFKKFNSYQNISLVESIMMMNLVRPAIMTALFALKENPEVATKWADALRYQFETNKKLEAFKPNNWSKDAFEPDDISDIEKIASLILNEVEEKSFKSFDKIIKTNYND